MLFYVVYIISCVMSCYFLLYTSRLCYLNIHDLILCYIACIISYYVKLYGVMPCKLYLKYYAIFYRNIFYSIEIPLFHASSHAFVFMNPCRDG